MTAKRARDGRGGKAFRRAGARLKREVQLKGLSCAICGEPIDTALPRTDPMAFQADHVVPIAAGGAVMQRPQPSHARCNRAKGANVEVDLDGWTAT